MRKRIGTCMLILLLWGSLGVTGCKSQETVQKKIRPASRAGQFYPASKTTLREILSRFFQNASAPSIHGDIFAIWVPHAGYVYSGQIAANAYRLVQGKPYDVAIVIGPSHYYPLRGAVIGDWDSCATPLGSIAVERNLVQALDLASDAIDIIPDMDKGEHSVEVQFPFLCFALPGVPVVSLVIGSLSLEKCEQIAQTIVKVVKNKSVLLVASSDMSHYPSYESACKTDKEVLSAVAEFNIKKIFSLEKELPQRGIPNLECSLCGASALVTVMRTAQLLGANKVHVLPYANSGDITGDRQRVVGYGAAVFYRAGIGRSNNKGGNIVEEIAFTEEEKNKLFQIARAHIQAALSGERPPEFHVTEPNLLLKRGVFVTLTNHGRLRGCIGHFEPDLPLYEIVAQMAVMSATEDARFFYDPITKDELDDIDIKISILSPLKKIDSIDEIEIGKHGIWVRWGRQSGTYLPEVAEEMGWNKEEFLEHCCVEKAGLPRDAWKKGAEIYIYSSQVLKEK